MINLLFISIWIIFAAISGVFEAFLFAGWIKHGREDWEHTSHSWKSIFKHDIHITLNIIRLVVGIFLALLLYRGDIQISSLVLQGSVTALASIFVFPFIHDGVYYVMRNKIDHSYPLGFKSESTTTSAKFSFGWKLRLSMFIGGLVMESLLMILHS